MSIGVLVQLDYTGDTNVRTFFLKENQKLFTVGRSDECDLSIDDIGVSRSHAQIEKRDKEFFLVDRGSRNGTRVNGVAVARRSLRDGDRITFGRDTFIFNEVVNQEERISVGIPVDMDAKNLTVLIPADVLSEKPDSFAAVTAWQVMKNFGVYDRHSDDALMKKIIEDIAGFRVVGRAVLYLAEGVMGSSAQWYDTGDSAKSLNTNFARKHIIEAADTGKAMPARSGNKSVVMRYVCLPIIAGGVSTGALYVEGRKLFAPGIVSALTGVAEAIGIGLALRSRPGAGQHVRSIKRDDMDIIGHSAALLACMRHAEKAAAVDSTVLIRGESGTGKDLFAKMIFEESARSKGPFIRVHSSAIEENLLGSTLFGHEKGAFTGAVGMKRGLFEEADGGTIFLDEIGELSMSMQVKLLRVLQEGEFMRIGSNKMIHVDVRVIAATNRDLEKAVEAKLFREDLYYRLKVIELRLPSMRERKEDIEELVNYFISVLGPQVSSRCRSVSASAMNVLMKYDWPGNVRELRNVLERSLVFAQGEVLNREDLPSEIVESSKLGDTVLLKAMPAFANAPWGNDKKLRVQESDYILRVLDDCEGNKKQAAEQLGISRSTLYEKLKKTS